MVPDLLIQIKEELCKTPEDQAYYSGWLCRYFGLPDDRARLDSAFQSMSAGERLRWANGWGDCNDLNFWDFGDGGFVVNHRDKKFKEIVGLEFDSVPRTKVT